MSNLSVQNSRFIKRHPIAAYYVLALAFSWLVELPLVAVKQGWINLKVPFAIHYLASFGPAMASVLVTAVITGSKGLRELWGRITRWRAGRMWVVFSIFSPLAMFAVSILVVRLVKGNWPDLRLLGQPNYLPYLGAGVVFLWLVSFGFGEEIGWRGFALPRLQKTMSVSKATLLLAVMWALWHMPAFLYVDTLRQVGWIILPGFLIGVLFAAVLFTWIYNGTNGSILYVAVWHALFDMFTASKVGQDIIPIVMSTMVILSVLMITRVNRPWNFHRVEKRVL